MTDSITRTFRLHGPAQAAVEAIRPTDGVLAAQPGGADRVRITYDVARTDYGTLRQRLAALGFPPPAGRLERWRTAWYGFQDENLRSNARHKPACCSKPPPGAGRR